MTQEGCRSTPLSTGWVCHSTPASKALTSLAANEGAAWFYACVPGTIASALKAARQIFPDDLHAWDHWYRLDTPLPEGAWLEFVGLATHAEIWIDGTVAATSESMFVPRTVPLPPGGAHRLELCFRALRPILRKKRSGPRARWRSRLALEEGLRGHRTTLLGHMPGWSGDTPVIGPFRPITLHEPIADAPVVTRVDLRSSLLPDGTGLISARLEGLNLSPHDSSMACAGRRIALQASGDALEAELRVPAPSLWWPHTHGEPVTYAVTAEIDGSHIDLGRIGFRTIACRDPGEGFGLVVNGAPVFCRGAIWAGLDITAEPADPGAAPLVARARPSSWLQHAPGDRNSDLRVARILFAL